jgi:hypothetical protein
VQLRRNHTVGSVHRAAPGVSMRISPVVGLFEGQRIGAFALRSLVHPSVRVHADDGARSGTRRARQPIADETWHYGRGAEPPAILVLGLSRNPSSGRSSDRARPRYFGERAEEWPNQVGIPTLLVIVANARITSRSNEASTSRSCGILGCNAYVDVSSVGQVSRCPQGHRTSADKSETEEVQ